MDEITGSYPVDFIVDSIGPDDTQIVSTNDFDYSYQEDTEQQYNAYNHPITRLIYLSLRLVWGPLNVLYDYREIILIGLAARLISLLLWNKTILKQLVLILLGIHQIRRYLIRSCPDLQCNFLCGLVYTVASSYTFYSAIDNRFRSLIVKANVKNLAVVYMISLYLIAFAPILYIEYLILHDINGNQYCFTRPIFMSMSMKFISLTSVSQKHKSPMHLLAYFIHPSSTIIGMWHPYETENSHKLNWPDSMIGLGKQLLKLALILSISSNIYEIEDYLDLLTSSQQIKSIINVYLVALEFRVSHYFSCYLASSLLNPIPNHPDFHEEFCDISKVEWPRSLVDVVTSWNLPMHCWLKRYVFKQILHKSNAKLAILLTYLVSSMLHGFKFHIWSVLLTLGILSWAEYNLRSKIADKLDACVGAKPCHFKWNPRTSKLVCSKGHARNTNNSPLVALTNFVFRIVTIMQLAYLGYIFVGNTDELSYMDVVERWESIYFYGHFLGIILLVIPQFIPI